jgi:hypothetical protein
MRDFCCSAAAVIIIDGGGGDKFESKGLNLLRLKDKTACIQIFHTWKITVHIHFCMYMQIWNLHAHKEREFTVLMKIWSFGLFCKIPI